MHLILNGSDFCFCSADDLDQTHVSVVTVGDGGDELVKDSSSCSSSLTHHGDAASDISSVAQSSSSGKSENGERVALHRNYAYFRHIIKTTVSKLLFLKSCY